MFELKMPNIKELIKEVERLKEKKDEYSSYDNFVCNEKIESIKQTVEAVDRYYSKFVDFNKLK